MLGPSISHPVIIFIICINPSITLNRPCLVCRIEQPGMILYSERDLSLLCNDIEVVTIILDISDCHDSRLSYLIPLGVILAPLKMNPRILNGSLIKNHRILNGSSNNVFIFPLLLVLPMFGWRRDLWAQDFPHILACN